MSTLRWVFEEVEGGATYTVPINPDSMSSPFRARNLAVTFTSYAHSPDIASTLASPRLAKEWEFSGVIRTQQHHDDLVAWSQKPGKIRITDHLSRTFEVIITAFEPVERRPTPGTPWRLRYTIKTQMLRRIA